MSSNESTLLMRLAMRQQERHASGRRLARGVVAIGTIGAVTLSAGVAYAYWTTSASGTGVASSTSAKTVTVSAGTGAADLYPGAAGAVSFVLDNRTTGNATSGNGNAFGATFNTVTAISVTSTDTTNCPSANVVSNVTLPYSVPSITVNGNTLGSTQTIASLVKMLPSAPDGCQGKTFNVSLTLSGTSN